MKEQPRHKKAFEFYVGLEKRSLAKVSREFNVSVQSLIKWSKAFNWKGRLKERDEKNAKAIAEKTDTEIVTQDTQNIKIARAAIKVFAQSLIGHVEHICKCGEISKIPIPKAKLTADQFDKMVRLEKFIIGEEDSRAGTVINVNLLPCDPVPRKPVKSKEIQ